MDDLHSDAAAEIRLLGSIDAPHPAHVDELGDDVAARKRAADQRIAMVLPDRVERKAARRAEAVLGLTSSPAVRTSLPPHDRGNLARTMCDGDGRRTDTASEALSLASETRLDALTPSSNGV